MQGVQDNMSALMMTTLSPSLASNPFFHVEFELHPENKKSDYRLNMCFQPFKIIYHAVSKMKNFDLN